MIRLKELRRKANINQNELAKKTRSFPIHNCHVGNRKEPT